MSAHYTGPKRREEDRDRRWKLSEWFLKYQFIWWPLVLAGVAYPAKVVSGLKSDTKASVELAESRLQEQIDTLKTQVRQATAERAEIREIGEALLASTCADLPPREQIRRRIAKACQKIGAPPYRPTSDQEP